MSADASKPAVVVDSRLKGPWVTRADALACLVLAALFVGWVAFIAWQQARAGSGIEIVRAVEEKPCLVNLNTADLQELMLLPQIGRARAERILKWRAEHGEFKSLAEVRKAAGLSEKATDGLSGLVTLGEIPADGVAEEGQP